MKRYLKTVAIGAALSVPVNIAAAETTKMSFAATEDIVVTQAAPAAAGLSADTLPILLAVIFMIAAAGGSSAAAPTTLTFSDKNLKTDIDRIGISPSGIPVYQYSYKGIDGRFQGAMAQDLTDLRPDAVQRHANGFLMVDYSLIDVDFFQLN